MLQAFETAEPLAGALEPANQISVETAVSVDFYGLTETEPDSELAPLDKNEEKEEDWAALADVLRSAARDSEEQEAKDRRAMGGVVVAKEAEDRIRPRFEDCERDQPCLRPQKSRRRNG